MSPRVGIAAYESPIKSSLYSAYVSEALEAYGIRRLC